MQSNFSYFCCRLLTFFKINFFEKFFHEYHHCQSVLDPDQDRQNLDPELGPNCLQFGYQQATKVTASKKRDICICDKYVYLMGRPIIRGI